MNANYDSRCGWILNKYLPLPIMLFSWWLVGGTMGHWAWHWWLVIEMIFILALHGFGFRIVWMVVVVRLFFFLLLLRSLIISTSIFVVVLRIDFLYALLVDQTIIAISGKLLHCTSAHHSLTASQQRVQIELNAFPGNGNNSKMQISDYHFYRSHKQTHTFIGGVNVVQFLSCRTDYKCVYSILFLTLYR